ncbi:unnamed protein product [Brassica napus]|uniref:(rape) hypothetical protein n=1 Tax=Brassica napus TaxID=3708 RepID=A0A816L5W1_BRANA|nr:unnamed protein product [Brassica napus]
MAKETSGSTGRHRRLCSSTTSTLDCDSPRCYSVSLLGSNYQSEKNVCENPYVASDFSFTPLPAPQGIHGLCKKHPMVKIMTSEIDASLTEDSRVIPGLGEFADHYFGTDNSKKYQEYPGMPIT